MSNEQNATPIDDQLIVIIAIARAAGYDDGAAWIEKQATVFVERELAESEPSVVVGDKSNGTPHSEPSRTEAVASIFTPDETRQAYSSVPESLTVGQLNRAVRNLREEIHRIRIEGQVALADAERKLACGHPASLLVRSVESDYEYCQLCETRDRLRDAVENEQHYKYSLAAAEKRAKDADDIQAIKPKTHGHLSVRESYETMVRLFGDVGDAHMIISRNGDWNEESRDATRLPARVRKIIETNAALTRKLATARDGLVVIQRSDDAGAVWLRNTATRTLAAIDAPAAEGVPEAAGLPTHNEFAWVAEVTHNGAPVYFGGDFWTSDPNEAVRFARQQDAEQTIRLIPLHPNPKAIEHGWFTSPAPASAAPPPEPANAQGSEVVCRVGADFDEAHACNKPLPCNDHPQPPSAPRFTAEETPSGRDDEERFDDWLEVQGSAPSLAMAWNAALQYERHRTKERDDALERAARGALDVMNSYKTAMWSYADREVRDELSAVLAQRAKGKR